ncbi:MAG TPA: tRNA pseudouridine(55) synthase TruB [Gammaproteobacteria bacterium]|nr:tRNA pseudouridine(55) synthase TruB [Gammaproteobacteria bacterium]|tara:strand:+ start:1158 stop:2117 length:960 start_codon:yes stop_codon:yes gene_type:complete
MVDQPKYPPSKRDVTGIFLLDKPAGISSNEALQRVKRIFGATKAGHTGSLDLIATGLLPICFGEATKVCAFLLNADKCYVSEFQLGVVTSTGDREGSVLRRTTNVTLDPAFIERTLARFRGEIQQVPPMFSALKRGGQPLYKLARKGISVERKPRTVKIYELDSLGLLDGDLLRVEISCSKGTYVRTLAEDIGEILKCGAHVSELRRLKVGPYSIDDSLPLDELTKISQTAYSRLGLDKLLLAADTALVDLPDICLSEESAFYIKRGQAIRVCDAPEAGFVRLYISGRQFIGVGIVLDDGRIAPRRLIREGISIGGAKS